MKISPFWILLNVSIFYFFNNIEIKVNIPSKTLEDKFSFFNRICYIRIIFLILKDLFRFLILDNRKSRQLHLSPCRRWSSFPHHLDHIFISFMLHLKFTVYLILFKTVRIQSLIPFLTVSSQLLDIFNELYFLLS